MLNTVHVVAAAAIVVTIPDPRISLSLALLSHIVLDTIPHWNWSPGRTSEGKWASVAEGLLALCMIGWLGWRLELGWVGLVAGLLSMLPDVVQAPYHFWGWRPGWLNAFVGWERKRQKWPWMKPWMGMATQAFILLGCLLVILS